MIKKVLFREGNKYYWFGNDLHTNFGLVKENDLKRCKGIVKSNTGKEFFVLDANFTDQLEKIKRGPAVMIQKDIGIIISNTGIDKDSVVLDAGTGCGVTAALLAKVVKKVITYEQREDFFKIAKKNFEFLGLDNVEQKLANIYDGVSERGFDLIVLDLPEPWRVLPNVCDALKQGCFLVAYLPTITQVSDLVSNSSGFLHSKTIEVLEREWHIEGKKVRPKSQMIAHTGFLVFLRKV